MSQPPSSPRSQVRRLPDRGAYDRETIHAILDAGLVCHVGFVSEGQPFVIPMNYGRDGDRLLLHGSAASRLMRGMEAGWPVCLTVTLLDGLVLARSAFHHSMNFRSVMLFGRATPVADSAAKTSALRAISEHLVPGPSHLKIDVGSRSVTCARRLHVGPKSGFTAFTNAETLQLKGRPPPRRSSRRLPRRAPPTSGRVKPPSSR